MLEVVIAVVVISVMAAGFLGTTIHTKRSSMLMQQRIAAAQLIDRKLAEIKASDGQTVTATVAPGTVTMVEIKDAEVLKTLKNAVMSVTGVYPEPSSTELKEVRVTVGWDYPWTIQTTSCALSGDGRACDKQESMVTVLFKE